MNDNVKDKSKPTVTRSIISVAASRSAPKFLEDLGFRPDFHFIARGLVFRKDRIRVTVNRVYKTETYNKESFADKDIQLLTTNWLVEASAIAPSNVPQVTILMLGFRKVLIFAVISTDFIFSIEWLAS